MWSSLTLRRSKDKTRDDTIAAAGDKDSDTANKKLSRAATFCYDSKYKEQNTKKSWLRNLPKVRNKFTGNKSEKIKEKLEVQETKVTNYGRERIGKDDRVKMKYKER
jgi:hypothetical protein